MSKHTILSEDDYDFENESGYSQDELYKKFTGKKSKYDKIDLENEYRKRTHKKKRKKLLDLDDDDEILYEDDEPLVSRSPTAETPDDYLPPAIPVAAPLPPTIYTSPPPAIITDPPPPPIVTAPSPAVTTAPSNYPATAQDEEEEIRSLALAIAEDFARTGGVVQVGDALYRYNGCFFQLLRDDEIRRLLLNLYRRQVASKNTMAILNHATSLLKICVDRVYDEFPVNPNIIVFPNGTLEVCSGKFRANSPDDLATSALNINYDPGNMSMPWTDYFLRTIANGDDDLYELMLQVIGYILSNDTKAKSFFYLEGVGDAGKSRFCDLIASFFPVSGVNKVSRIALQDLGGKFALGNLVNAKLNISEDLPDAPLSATTVSRIKMISDSNMLEAEAKYVQPFSFRPVCKMLFASNHPLRIKEMDEAFVNRVVYLPFRNPIPKDKQDKHISEKTQTELPALFNHALQAYQRLVENNYQWAGADKFKPNIVVTNSSLAEDKVAILRRFLRECCEFAADATTATSELQVAYEHFCHQNTLLPIAGDRFSRELASVLPNTVTRIKIGNQKRGFKGIRLKPVLKNYPMGHFVEEAYDGQ